MASYSLNKAAVSRARKLIDAHQCVLDSNWTDLQLQRVAIKRAQYSVRVPIAE